MPHFCGVLGCSNRSERDQKRYFRIPAIVKSNYEPRVELSRKRFDRWIHALKRADLTESKIKNMRICSDHFLSGAPADLDDVDNPDWVPNKKMGYSDSSISSTANNVQHTKRVQKRRRRSSEMTRDEGGVNNNILGDNERLRSVEVQSVEAQTDLTIFDMDQLASKNCDMTSQIANLKSQVNKLTFTQETFENDDEKTLYYTGIPSFAALMVAFNLVSPHLSETHGFSLSKFQQFVLTLMRLRLGLAQTDLAYRFTISKATVSSVYSECLYVLYQCLKKLVKWPERENLHATMPQSFCSSFGDQISVIVVDCFEIFTERPSTFLASGQTSSNYKHHDTIKFLVGIAPQGVVTFISKAWDGRVTDKFIVENSGILENLLPGDIVIADKGVTISDDVGLYCAEVSIPPFNDGRKQLVAYELEQTRNIAHIRIHVERIIKTLHQKFRILKNAVPVSSLVSMNPDRPAIIDQVVTVCCALVNMCPSVVPLD